MGYLLPTVTQAAFLNQQDVVQNEKGRDTTTSRMGIPPA